MNSIKSKYLIILTVYLRWKCYKCKDKCPCSVCRESKKIVDVDQMTKKKRGRKCKTDYVASSNIGRYKKIQKSADIKPTNTIKTRKKNRASLNLKKKLSLSTDQPDNKSANQNIDDTKIKEKLRVNEFLIYEYYNEKECAGIMDEYDLENKKDNFIAVCPVEKEDNLNKSSDNDSVFSKILEMEDDEPVNNIENNINFDQENLMLSVIDKESLTYNSKIFNLDKTTINKTIVDTCNKYSDEIDRQDNLIHEVENQENEKNSYREKNFLQENSTQNNNFNKSTLNINFQTYKSQIKINNYFIKHKSCHAENQIEEQLDSNENHKTFLTKPCLICRKARFSRNELLKLLTFEEFMLSFKYFIKQAEVKVEENNFDVLYLETFYENKKLFQEYLDKHFKSDPNLLKMNFRRGKRICITCFQNNIEKKPLGANELFELVTEEDEQAEMDQTKKNEIFSEIKKFMYINGYDVDKSFPIFSNSVDLSVENFNIFNMIFAKHRQEDSTWHRNSNVNSFSPYKTVTNFNSFGSKSFGNNVTLQNLSNFNDKPLVHSVIPSNFDKNKISLMKESSLIDKENRFDARIDEEKKINLGEIITNQCQLIKNTMEFEQLIVIYSIKCVEDYIKQLNALSTNIHLSIGNLTDTMCKLVAKRRDTNNSADIDLDSNSLDSRKINKPQGIYINYLLNLVADSVNENDQNCLSSSSFSSEEKSYIDNLNKLLFFDSKVYQSIIMLKTVMNCFTIYLPFFKKINSELFTFTNISQGYLTQMFLEQFKESDLIEAPIVETKNAQQFSTENNNDQFIEKNPIDSLASDVHHLLHDRGMNLKGE